MADERLTRRPFRTTSSQVQQSPIHRPTSAPHSAQARLGPSCPAGPQQPTQRAGILVVPTTSPGLSSGSTPGAWPALDFPKPLGGGPQVMRPGSGS